MDCSRRAIDFRTGKPSSAPRQPGQRRNRQRAGFHPFGHRPDI